MVYPLATPRDPLLSRWRAFKNLGQPGSDSGNLVDDWSHLGLANLSSGWRGDLVHAATPEGSIYHVAALSTVGSRNRPENLVQNTIAHRNPFGRTSLFPVSVLSVAV